VRSEWWHRVAGLWGTPIPQKRGTALWSHRGRPGSRDALAARARVAAPMSAAPLLVRHRFVDPILDAADGLRIAEGRRKRRRLPR